MKKAIVYLLCSTALVLRAQQHPGAQLATKPLTTIAFGSCNDVRRPMPLWADVLAAKPQLWLWMGDNVYTDTNGTDRWYTLRPRYARLKANPQYTQLRQQAMVIGHWDDHDFALNDGGKENPDKDSAKAALLDFLDVPAGAEVRGRPGIYQSYTLGPKGKQVKIILLDNRWFRDRQLLDSTKKEKTYRPNPDGDMLGQAQWQWLENELKHSKAQVHIISNGIQVLPAEHRFEKWSNLPTAKARLLQLLFKYKKVGNSAVLLSGDRHVAEFSRLDTNALAQPLLEFTVSGLTHTYDKFSYEPNRLRVRSGMPAATDGVVNVLHFGLMLIDWQKRVLTLRAVGRGGRVLAEQARPF